MLLYDPSVLQTSFFVAVAIGVLRYTEKGIKKIILTCAGRANFLVTRNKIFGTYHEQLLMAPVAKAY